MTLSFWGDAGHRLHRYRVVVILLVGHGESTWNTERRRAGRVDPLTAAGRDGAGRLVADAAATAP